MRPDGALVGLGRDITRQIALASPWLGADGTFNATSPFAVVTGAPAPDLPAADPDRNCNDWRSGTDTLRGSHGLYGLGDPRWFHTFTAVPCNTANALYCVEQ
ncbi:MAG TPA: hypothetical protein VJU61_09825 [Polyangiaceae bacterium]|nr:hypothetical protein [Polyangiaceae bacterium]